MKWNRHYKRKCYMPYETPVCHPQSFEAPPCAMREPLQKPVTIYIQWILLSQQLDEYHRKRLQQWKNGSVPL